MYLRKRFFYCIIDRGIFKEKFKLSLGKRADFLFPVVNLRLVDGGGVQERVQPADARPLVDGDPLHVHSPRERFRRDARKEPDVGIFPPAGKRARQEKRREEENGEIDLIKDRGNEGGEQQGGKQDADPADDAFRRPFPDVQRERGEQDSSPVQRIGGKEIDEKQGEIRLRGERSVSVGIRKDPPRCDEKDADREIQERPRRGDGDLVSQPEVLDIPADHRAVGHQDDAFQAVPQSLRNKRMPQFVNQGNDRIHDKDEDPSGQRVIQAEQVKQRVDFQRYTAHTTSPSPTLKLVICAFSPL